jgi:hypothetical protein
MAVEGETALRTKSYWSVGRLLTESRLTVPVWYKDRRYHREYYLSKNAFKRVILRVSPLAFFSPFVGKRIDNNITDGEVQICLFDDGSTYRSSL